MVVAFVGGVDALREGSAVFVVLFTTIIVLNIAQILTGGPPSVRLRSDHNVWLRRVGSVTGESHEVVADRAISAYRELLDHDR